MLAIHRTVGLDEAAHDTAQWRDMLNHCPGHTIFQHPGWQRAWAQTVGRHWTPVRFEAFEGRDRVGMATMALDPTGRCLGYCGAGNADYTTFLTVDATRATADALADSILEFAERRGLDIELQNLPCDSVTREALITRAQSRNRLYTVSRPVACPAISAQKGPLRPRYSLRRHINALRHLGSVTVDDVQERSVATTHLETFFAQHQRRWTDDALLGGQFAAAPTREFYRRLLDNGLSEGWIKFSMLRLNGYPIAYHFGFDYDDRLLWYKSSYDPQFARRSPGTALIAGLLEFCAREGREAFDFSVGEEAFKMRYANDVRYNTHFVVHGNRRGYLKRLSRQTASALRARVKRAAEKSGAAPSKAPTENFA